MNGGVAVFCFVVACADHKFIGDLNEDGKTILVCKGGRGGKGNACFKSSTNRVPKIAENGEPGQRPSYRNDGRVLRFPGGTQ